MREQFKLGKIKPTEVRKFLTKYYEGNPMEVVKGSTNEQNFEDYLDIHLALIDDREKLNNFKTLYVRHKQKYCCGNRVATVNTKSKGSYLLCEICGSEYRNG